MMAPAPQPGEAAMMATSRAADLLEAARRSIERGRPVAARALVDATRAAGFCPDELDELDGRLMLDEGRTEAALRLAGRAVARSPRNWRLLCLRADALLATRDPAGAAADAAEAVVAAPRESAPKAVLGSALLALGLAADASACLREAVAAQPTHVGYRLAFASALVRLGRTEDARGTLQEAIGVRPRALALRTAAIRVAVGVRDHEAALALADDARADGVIDACILGLRGHALSCLGRDEAAGEAYREALQLAPEDRYVRHLAAASGLVAPPDRASPDYVRVLFDGFAGHFERDLVSLDYRVPGLVRAALLAQAPDLAQGAALGPVLDLGCGTGLVAVVLSDLAVGPFTGVDLSPGMLAEAAAKGLYERLIAGDICDALPSPGDFRLAVAADVLPYLGDPAPVLASVWPLLCSGSLFILTIEALADDDAMPFRLGPRARYAHRPDLLCATARAAGFTVRACQPATLRRDRDCPVQGCVVVLQRAAEGGAP